jgi:putative endonuclease
MSQVRILPPEPCTRAKHGSFTENLKQRLIDHFHGNSKSTAPRRPFKLIFCEYFLSKADAQRREKYFKTTKGKRTLKLILKIS